jgi:hypothetical protein
MMAMVLALTALYVSRIHRYTVLIPKKINWLGADKLILLTLFIVLFLYILYLNNFSFNFGITNVYIRRLAARETVGRFSGYLIAICRSGLTILAVYLFAVKKKKVYLVLIILIALSIFSLDGTKSTILNLLFLFFVAYMLSYNSTILFFPLAFLILIVIGILEYTLLNTNIISQYFIRRMSIVPGFINTLYWDYFSTHNKVLLTDSIGKYVFGTIYELPTTFLIGLEYFNTVRMNANTGIWMGGYAHFGAAGIFMMSVFGGILLGFIDNILKYRYFLFGALTCTYIGINWCEQMLHTSVLSGGIFYIIILIMFILSSKHLSQDFSHHKPKRKRS